MPRRPRREDAWATASPPSPVRHAQRKLPVATQLPRTPVDPVPLAQPAAEGGRVQAMFATERRLALAAAPVRCNEFPPTLRASQNPAPLVRMSLIRLHAADISRRRRRVKEVPARTLTKYCKRLGIKPPDYLHDVLSRLPVMTNQQTRSLTRPTGSPPGANPRPLEPPGVGLGAAASPAPDYDPAA